MTRGSFYQHENPAASMPTRGELSVDLKIVFELRVMAYTIHNSVTFHAIADIVSFFHSKWIRDAAGILWPLCDSYMSARLRLESAYRFLNTVINLAAGGLFPLHHQRRVGYTSARLTSSRAIKNELNFTFTIGSDTNASLPKAEA